MVLVKDMTILFTKNTKSNEMIVISSYSHIYRKIKKVNIILLSHAEIQYHGALPYLFFELGCQVIITQPKSTKFNKILGGSVFNFASLRSVFGQHVRLHFEQMP